MQGAEEGADFKKRRIIKGFQNFPIMILFPGKCDNAAQYLCETPENGRN